MLGAREGTERASELARERAQYRFNDSGSFSILSTIRTVDCRQESESPSSTLASHPRRFSPFLLPLVAIMLVPRQLTVDRFYRFPSFATARGCCRRSSSFSTLRRAGSPPIRILSPSSRVPRVSRLAAPRAVDIAGIESDVESALSGSSGKTGIPLPAQPPPVPSSSLPSRKLSPLRPPRRATTSTENSVRMLTPDESFGPVRFFFVLPDSRLYRINTSFLPISSASWIVGTL